MGAKRGRGKDRPNQLSNGSIGRDRGGRARERFDYDDGRGKKEARRPTGFPGK